MVEGGLFILFSLHQGKELRRIVYGYFRVFEVVFVASNNDISIDSESRKVLQGILEVGK